jgi:uncharacterized protein involved in response to NO
MSMPAALARRRNYAGPSFFSYGFRPFFFCGALWAAVAVLLWLPQHLGVLALPIRWAPLDWHVHEMIFGYAGAVIAGFLLTAIPNWTGRLPVNGAPLMALVCLWLAGRLAMLASAQTGALAAAVIDVSFLATLAGVALREIVAGRNWRNLRVLIVLGVLIAGNVVFHVEAAITGAANYGTRIGVAAILGMIMLVGGRIVPSFTHNWLARQKPGRMPRSFGRFDAVALAVAVIALAGWVVAPDHGATGLALLLAGALHAARLARWAGDRTIGDRLVLVLHVAYAFVPTGFVLTGLATLWPAVPATAGIHAWTAGAVGLMTLAVMTRATLGHTGRRLEAGMATQLIYLLALAGAVARCVAPFVPTIAVLHAAGFLWTLAFIAFTVVYGRFLLQPRAVGGGT